MHRMYIDMGFRHEVYHFEWFCITFMTFTFPVEYLVTLVCTLITFPTAMHDDRLQIDVFGYFNINLAMSYIVLLYLSVPYFFSTLVYVCRKRSYQLHVKELALKEKYKRRAIKMSGNSLSDDEESD